MPAVEMDKLFLYSGAIDFQKKRELIAGFFHALEEKRVDAAELKRMVYIFEELLTNAHEYYKRNNLEAETLSVTAEKTNNGKLELHVSSVILQKDTSPLQKQLDELNSISGDKLKEVFNASLKKKKTEGGGGLGLITVKLKNGTDFKSEITPINETLSLFKLIIETDLTV